MFPNKILFHCLRDQPLHRHTRMIVIPPRTSSVITSLTRRIRKAVVIWMIKHLVEYRPCVNQGGVGARLGPRPVYEPGQNAVEEVNKFQLLRDGVGGVGKDLRGPIDCYGIVSWKMG